MLKSIFIIFLIIIFLLGLYLYSSGNLYETFINTSASASASCPDILINTGDVLLLYNSKLPKKDGENPLPLYNLDEYINYVALQKKKGNNCPILYLQKENNAQGKDVYKIRDNPFNPQNNSVILEESRNRQMLINFMPTLATTTSSPQNPIKAGDSSRDNPPYNQGQYAGFDPLDLYVGEYTDIDKLHDSTATTAPISENPMDSNWGGVMHTQKAIESGKYDENNVAIKVA